MTPEATRARRAGRLLVLALLVLLLMPLAAWVAAAPAAAHGATTTARAEATGVGEDIEVVLELEYDLLMKSAWLYADAYEATEVADQRRQLERHADDVETYVVDRFQVAYGDERCAGSAPEPADVVERDGRSHAELTVLFDCDPSAGGNHAFFSALFPDDENFVHSTRTMVRYDVDGETGSALLEAADPRFDVVGAEGTSDGSTTTPAEDSAATRLADFTVLGAEHLLLGPDHLLFLLALLIGARGVRDVVLTATSFTLAHSVTFALASLGVVSVPAQLVEPLIAASIVVVALVGLRDLRHSRRDDGKGCGPGSRWRLPTAFGFGLLHGLGFAGALGIEDAASWDLLWSLLAFNVGIEIAQVAVILAVFPLLLLLRRAPAGGVVAGALTVGVALVGTFWLVERLSEAGSLLAAG